MNLIERLGGYEKAKRALDREIRLTSPNTFYCLKLNDALLEYRRQHNIYEVGDKVVLSGGNCTLMYKLHERIGKYVYLKRPSGREYEFHIDDIRHATDEEIEAGKRLEVS